MQTAAFSVLVARDSFWQSAHMVGTMASWLSWKDLAHIMQVNQASRKGVTYVPCIGGTVIIRNSDQLAARRCSSLLHRHTTSLEFHGGGLVADPIYELITACTNLTSLKMDNLECDCVPFVSRTIESNPRLTAIHLVASRIDGAGAAALAEAIQVSKAMRTIDLSNNKLSDAGAVALAKAVALSPSLTRINVSENEISAEGTAALAEAIKISKTIKVIALKNNHIDAAGACALAEAIKISPSLTTVDLSDNHVCDAGANALAEAIRITGSLIAINLTCNNISAASAGALAMAIESGKTVTTVSMNGNRPGASRRLVKLTASHSHLLRPHVTPENFIF